MRTLRDDLIIRTIDCWPAAHPWLTRVSACVCQRKRELEADEAASKKIRKKEYVKKGQLEKKWAKQSSKSAGVGDD